MKSTSFLGFFLMGLSCNVASPEAKPNEKSAEKGFYFQGVRELKEGTYTILRDSTVTCCSNLELRLRIKKYMPFKYHFSIEGFAEETIENGCYPCEGEYLMEQHGSQMVLLQKSNSELDSVQIQSDPNGLVQVQHWSQSRPILNKVMRFQYVNDRLYTFYNRDVNNRFFYVPQFSDSIQVSFYEYPDNAFPPKVFHLAPKSLLSVATMKKGNPQGEKFHLVYFEAEDPKEISFYEDYKEHLWIKESDLLAHFGLDRDGHL